MSILKVAHMGHPILRTKARALDRREIKTPAIQKLIDDMIETMDAYHGAGLAAPQVHVGVRLYVVLSSADEGRVQAPVVLVNPELSSLGADDVDAWEGCLSVPDIHGMVPRAREIAVRALDRKGERLDFRACDFAARVIQHEHDHIDGVLFIDRMRSLESLTFVSVAADMPPTF